MNSDIWAMIQRELGANQAKTGRDGSTTANTSLGSGNALNTPNHIKRVPFLSTYSYLPLPALLHIRMDYK